jgi:hypothetical protein
MARPPQYDRDPYDDDAPPTPAVVKMMLKRLDAKGRAHVLVWLCNYFDDRGEKYGTIRRRRVELSGAEHWVVKIPARK